MCRISFYYDHHNKIDEDELTKTTPTNAPKGVAAFDRPQLVKHQDAARFLWGDAKSGQVADLIYGRNTRISALIFKLKPGGFFRSSDTWKSFFDQHRYYYVIKGQLTIQDPQSGEVVTAKAGEAIYWRGAKWHFGFNFSSEETAVLDWYAPQERAPHIPEIEFAKTKPVAGPARAGREDLLGKWPELYLSASDSALKSGGIVRVCAADALGFIFGEQNPVMESVFVSSTELTAGTVSLIPGSQSDMRTHPGDKVIFNLEGQLHVYLPELFEWHELNAWDVLYLPPNTPHQYWNYTSTSVKFAFMVVPAYL
jgi:quercetin dioxygenase-like cupin family protein